MCETLITMKHAAGILGIKTDTLWASSWGTHVLTRVRLGSYFYFEHVPIRYILEEVEELKAWWTECGISQGERTNRSRHEKEYARGYAEHPEQFGDEVMSSMRSRNKPPEKQTLITAKQAKEILTISVSSILNGKCGTDVLTVVRLGNSERARVRFVLEEVEALKAKWITDARAHQGRFDQHMKLIRGW